MKRETIGEIIFWAATLSGITLYFFSAPVGLPWSGSTKVALAWAGEIAELPEMPNPVWGYFIQVFGGRFVALSCVAAALAAGLIGSIVNRYLGWRIAAAAALTWIFLPPIWNRAITGVYSVFWVSLVVLAVWLVNVVMLLLTRRARKVFSEEVATVAGVGRRVREFWIGRVAGWAFLISALLFTLVSLVEHDFTVGEVASAYARTILEEAGERIVIMGGIVDEQMVWEAERQRKGASSRLLAFRNDDAYREQLVKRVRNDWPGETNLWVAAQIGLKTFAELAVLRHPERIYLMTGKSTTPEKWALRWESMKQFLDSDDRFIPVMRRAFAFEANTLANQLQDDGKMSEAWRLYWRILDEVDRENLSAVVNLNEMLRRGYKTDEQHRKRIENAMSKLRKSFSDRRTVAVMASCGPVRPDTETMKEFRAELEKRKAELAKRGEEFALPPSLKSLIEWSDEMIRAYNNGDMTTAARIARTILARREGRGFIPANAVMGAAMAKAGDYVASEVFYRTAVSGVRKPPITVCNDYADTLRHLGRLDEAERYARQGLAEAPETNWIVRLTLAEILRDAKKNPEEVKDLLKVVQAQAPEVIRIRIKKEFRSE